MKCDNSFACETLKQPFTPLLLRIFSVTASPRRLLYELKTNYSNTVDLGNNIHKLSNGSDPSAIKIPNNERNQFPGAFLEGVNEDHLMEAATKKYTGKVRHSPAWTVSLLVQFQLV